MAPYPYGHDHHSFTYGTLPLVVAQDSEPTYAPRPTYAPTYAQDSEPEMRSAFNLLDRDGSGHVDKEEIINVVVRKQNPNPNPNPKEP